MAKVEQLKLGDMLADGDFHAIITDGKGKGIENWCDGLMCRLVNDDGEIDHYVMGVRAWRKRTKTNHVMTVLGQVTK